MSQYSIFVSSMKWLIVSKAFDMSVIRMPVILFFSLSIPVSLIIWLGAVVVLC